MTAFATEAKPMKTWSDASVALAEALPGYEPRPQQDALAHAIESIFGNADNFTAYNGTEESYWDWERPGISHLLGQAGCGTGKSLAYLIPAILSNKRVVVSVTTKALQDQIVTTDLPFLAEHLPVHFTWALLKGRGNYLCLNRLGIITEAEAPVEALRAMWEASKDPSFSGERTDIAYDIPDHVWRLAASESEECGSTKCSTTECYAAAARQRASEANLVIVNHALFFTDLSLKTWTEGMLGHYDLVVFDEAHALEEVAGNVLGNSVSEGTFNSLTNQVHRWGNDHADDDGLSLSEPVAEITQAAANLFARIHAMYAPTNGTGRLRTTQLNDMVDEFGAIFDSLTTLHKALKAATYEHASDYTQAGKRRWRLTRQCLSLIDKITDIIAAPAAEMVRWVEQDKRKSGEAFSVIKTAPILVAPFLRRMLYTKTPTVLVSATLAVKGSMEYIAGRLGVPTYFQIDVGTPFDFTTQGRLYIPVLTPGGQAFPAPARETLGQWEGMAVHEIHRLVTASRGRALVLFTSIKHMKATYEQITRMEGDLTYRMQGERGVNNRDLVDWLKDGVDGGRVLFATKSFFTGIDIPGEALSLLVITKMPFPVPDEPLTQARCEAIEAAGGDSFMDFTVPVMSLELQQGVGRLIRHRDDIGVAAILDPRLVNKGYGKRILRDLPPMPQTFKMEDVATFFEEAS